MHAVPRLTRTGWHQVLDPGRIMPRLQVESSITGVPTTAQLFDTIFAVWPFACGDSPCVNVVNAYHCDCASLLSCRSELGQRDVPQNSRTVLFRRVGAHSWGSQFHSII